MSAGSLSADDLRRIGQARPRAGERIDVVETSAGRMIVKRARAPRHPARYAVLNGLARLLAVPFLRAAPVHGGTRALALEVARLGALRAAGVPVPAVLHVAPDHFVMQWLGGEHLAILLEQRHACAAALWAEGGRAIVHVHRAGQYLSQAFARNFIVDTRADPPRLAGLIDFEDDPLEVMTLPEAQARDWLSYLHSTLWTLQLSADAVDAALDAWLRDESPQVRQQFLKACRKLAWLRVLPRQRRFGRDTVALQAAAAAAHRYLARHTPARATA